ncbi:MAG: hypothetical protein IKZ53_09560 [Selenomonadaceae bacterium]|nr:hypothetical protein [Selenomonadaceae bacterium]
MEESKSLFKFYSKQELADNFSLDELLNFARQRNLQEWFAENFYASEARKVAAAINNELNDSEFKLLICKLFDLPIETLSADELEEISLIVAKKQRRELFMKKLPGDDRKIDFVETQGELVKALKNEAQLIYLYGGEFRIPLNRRGVTYVGCENAVIDFDEEFDIDLDASEIVLENLQVYLRHAINLQASKSKNIKILDGSKKALTQNVSLKEIFHILRGRKAFESPENFKLRTEDIKGAAVGETLLENKDYEYEAAQFTFNPHWNFEYISILKDFAGDKDFSIKILPHDAEALYINERKLQIFADFTYRNGKLTILKLYFSTKTLGIITIEINLREEKITSASSGFGCGYGLEIITAYEENATSKEKSEETKSSINCEKIISGMRIGVNK